MIYVIGIAAAIIFGWLSFKKPSIALGILLALVPAYQIRYDIFIPTTLLELGIVVFLLGALLANYKNLGRLKNLGQINWAVALFLLAGAISVLISPETTKALGQYKAFILEPVILFYAIIICFKSESDFKLPVKFLFGAASLVALAGLIQYITLLGLPLRFWGNGEEVRRIASVFEYPNALALYLAPLFVFFVVLWIRRWMFTPDNWLAIGLSIQAAAILLTFSRGAWLGIGTVLLILVIREFTFKKVGPILVALILLVLAVAPLRTRLLNTIGDPSALARMDLAQAAITKLKSSSVFGNGLYGFRTTLEEQKFNGEILNYPHNIIFNFWLETGLLGLLSFAGIIILAFQKYRIKPSALSLAAICFLGVLLIHGLVDVPYFKNDLAVLFWFVLSIIFI